RPVRSVDRVGNRDEDILTRIDQLDLRAIDSFSSSLSEDSQHVVAAVAVPLARFPPKQLDIGIEQLFESCEVAVLPALQSGARLLHQLSIHEAPSPLLEPAVQRSGSSARSRFHSAARSGLLRFHAARAAFLWW